MTGTVEGNPPDRLRTDISNLEFALANVTYLSPVQTTAFRDFYAFEAHVKAERQKRGVDLPAEWTETPTFYYCNPNTFYSHQAEVSYPAYTKELDYALEIGCMIGNPGRDISPENAYGYLWGYTILNNWTLGCWLQVGDVIELEVERLGLLRNSIV